MNYTEVVKKVSIKKIKPISCLVFLLFLSVSAAVAQMSASSAGAYHILGKSLVELKKQAPASSSISLPVLLTSQWSPSPTGPIYQRPTYLNYQAPKAYSFEHLAFFCRLEVKMEKASKMPVRFRLGSVPYVDQLEGKY